MPSNDLFDPMFTTPGIRAAVGAEAWLAAMLRVEAALANAEARVGLITPESAAAIAEACAGAGLDASAIGQRGIASANPVVPFVEALRALVPEQFAADLHLGATSQDILDTAAMLVSRRALEVILESIDASAGAAAVLADRHRDTPCAARTLGQQAEPTTFGLKAAGWLAGLLEARAALSRWRSDRIALQFGGPAGNLSSLGAQGLAVQQAVAVELGLPQPVLPWHTNRARIAELAAALGIAAGAAGKVALDISLMAQTEVGELSEGSGPGQGRSSSMPHKRNPAVAVAINASVRRAHTLVPLFFASMLQEHERAAGAWQAEWAPLVELLELTAAALSHLSDLLRGLRVDVAAMQRNLDLTGGLIMAGAVTSLLSERAGAASARALVDAAVSRALRDGSSLRDALYAQPGLAGWVTPEDLDAALNPRNQRGSAGAFIDRALARWEVVRGSRA